MIGLAPHRLLPCDAEPREIFVDRLPRIPGGSASRRCPRCAAGNARPARAPSRNRSARKAHGRDADSRSATARNGKRVASWFCDPRLDPQDYLDKAMTIGCHHARRKRRSRAITMTTHINTEADLDAGIAALIAARSALERGSRARRATAAAPPRRAASRVSRRSSCRSRSRSPAPPRSTAAWSPSPTRSITRPCCAHARTSCCASACRMPKSRR